jgi:hypothetical protein
MMILIFLIPSCIFIRILTFKAPDAAYFKYYKLNHGKQIPELKEKTNGVFLFREFDTTVDRELYGFYYLNDTGYLGMDWIDQPDKTSAMQMIKRWHLNPPKFYKHQQFYGYYAIEYPLDFRATYVTILKDAGTKINFETEGVLDGDTLTILREIAYYKNTTKTSTLNRTCIFESFDRY